MGLRAPRSSICRGAVSAPEAKGGEHPRYVLLEVERIMATVKALVLVGGPYHDEPGAREELSAALLAHSDAELTLTDDTTALVGDRLSAFDVVVVYTTGGKLAASEEEALAEFVRAGKGFFGLHGAAASYKENRLFHEVLGCTFVEHPPLGEVAVQVRDPFHPITAGVQDFSVADELYILDYDPEDIDLLTTARLGPEGEAQLSAYDRAYGAGRVFYLGLGHDARCLRAEPFRVLAGRGLMWAAGK